MLLLLLAGCRTDPALHSQRTGPGQYRLTVDRCHAIDRDQLQRDLRGLADQACPNGAGSLEAVESVPSRQGSLFGECLRSGALRADVRCR
ncbi:hypothetical protein KQ945_03560 [Bacillus subtilis subsp. subtilis]|nr:hypothetical protein [Bacillus subtilis subsp. subtilis]